MVCKSYIKTDNIVYERVFVLKILQFVVVTVFIDYNISLHINICNSIYALKTLYLP